MTSPGIWTRLSDFFWSDPLMGVGVAAAVVALASTPLAFAVLGRLDWFRARRGRVMMRPSFASIVCGMMLVMGIPAIFCLLAIKSRHFDESRYEFDPNHIPTVIDQGRLNESLDEMNAAVRAEMDRLANERKLLVEGVKKLDQAMLGLRAAAGVGTTPGVAKALPDVLQQLAGVRKSVGVDAPQQLQDFTAPPVDLAKMAVAAPLPAYAATAPIAPVAIEPTPAGGGLSPVDREIELAAVPGPQKNLAAMLPLSGLPEGWEVGKAMGPSGKARLETFNAENLFEKIDGRAESFLQYDVRGMAYTFLHPKGDESGEVQVYIFEMGAPIKAFGKYGSEKPEEATTIDVGADGYTSAGSTFFYQGPFYTQLVTNRDEPEFAAFALDMARRIADLQKPPDVVADNSPGDSPTKAAVTPEMLFALLPKGPNRASPKFVAQDVFGYSFFSDVFLADYEDEGTFWQGFLRPYATPEAAASVFEEYLEGVKRDGAETKMVESEGVDRMVVSSNVGLIDVVFLKGNAVGGANGATDAGPAETFARSFAGSLPEEVPAIESTPSPSDDPEAGQG